MRRILTCVGTRPNLIKIKNLKSKFLESGFVYKLLHTGQHYDYNMSQVFFEQLKIDKPDYFLNISTNNNNNKTVSEIINRIDDTILDYKPDLVIVPGDVNSTFACAFASASYSIPVAHIESGLRSFDMSMPEERNRILTDRLSELLFVTEESGVYNLAKEGVVEEKIKFVGNTIIDSLVDISEIIDNSELLKQLKYKIKNKWILCTFHRPINVDTCQNLTMLVDVIERLSKINNVIFPVHPRTKKKLEEFSLINRLTQNEKVILIEPIGYIDFLALMKNSFCVVSDSGGVQIESSFLNIPCFTIRDTTELLSTINFGTNKLLKLQPDKIEQEVKILHEKINIQYNLPWFWDGKATDRIVQEISNFLK